MTDYSETDDFLRAKDLIREGLKIEDVFMMELVTKYLRDECLPLTRTQRAKDVLQATREKHSPIGWLRTCIERGTLTAALRASGAKAQRIETRRDTPAARGKIEVRRKLRELYEQLHGAPPATKRLDDDGGLPWNDFALLAPRTAQAIKYRLDKRIQETRYEVEQDEMAYHAVSLPTWSDWCVVLDEFLQADGARVEAGATMTTL